MEFYPDILENVPIGNFGNFSNAEFNFNYTFLIHVYIQNRIQAMLLELDRKCYIKNTSASMPCS